MHQRFRQWRDDGTFDQVLSHLQLQLREDGLMDLDTWMIDSTAVRATRAASGGGKKGPKELQDHALGRSRAGLTTKTHLLCDTLGYPLSFTLSPGQHTDSRHFVETLDQVRVPGRPGRPIKRCHNVITDKGYDSEALRQHCDRHRMCPTIARRTMHLKLTCPQLSNPS